MKNKSLYNKGGNNFRPYLYNKLMVFNKYLTLYRLKRLCVNYKLKII